MADHPDVVAHGAWGAELRASTAVFDALRSRKIFLGSWAVPSSITLRWDRATEIEPYAYFPVFRPLTTTHAFSFSYSSWPMGTKIGRYCSLAAGCSVMAGRHAIEWASSSTLMSHMSANRGDDPWVTATHLDFNHGPFESGPMPRPAEHIDIAIGDDVWIGADARLAHNVKIGTGAVVATRSLVTRDVAPYMIVGGNPARVIRPRFDENLIPGFLESRWWEFGPDLWRHCNFKEPVRFLEDVAGIRQKSDVRPFRPEIITFRHILKDLGVNDNMVEKEKSY